MENSKVYTYIKQSQYGKFVEFDEPLKEEEYNNLGTTWNDYLNNKWVMLSDEQVEFHNENPTASVEEVWNMELKPVPERTLEDAKSEMIFNINMYDISDNVNSFTINNETEGWFTPDERSNYKSSIDAAKLLGVSTLSFYVGDMLLEVTPAQAEYMLAQVQLYADQCFMVTKQHKLTVEGFNTIEEVDNFKYEEGYPQKINFTYPIENT